MFVNKFLEVTTSPAVEPVSIDEFKSFLKLLDDDDDELITELLLTARVAAESFTNRPLINTSYKQIQDNFEIDGFGSYSVQDELAYQADIDSLRTKQSYIKLLAPRVSSVASIKTYTDTNIENTYSTDNYNLLPSANKVIINDDATLPSNLRSRGGIEVNFTSGFGATASDVPSAIKTAIKIHAQNMYNYTRGGDVLSTEPYIMPDAAKALLRPYRLEIGING